MLVARRVEPPDQVVFDPALLEHDRRAVGLKPREARAAEPLLHQVSRVGALGLGAILVRVVHEQEVRALTREGPVDARGDRAAALGVAPLRDGVELVAEAEPGRARVPSGQTALALRELGAVRDVRHRVRRPCREIPRDRVQDELGLAVAWWGAHQRANALPATGPLEEVGDPGEVLRTLPSRRDPRHEVEERQAREALNLRTFLLRLPLDSLLQAFAHPLIDQRCEIQHRGRSTLHAPSPPRSCGEGRW